MTCASLGDRVQEIVERLLARESVGPDAARDMSVAFEVIASHLFGQLPERQGCYFDGVIFEASGRKSPRKVAFTGEIWVGRGEEQWKETFAATAIDKRITKQGIWLKIRVGRDVGETELRSILG